MSYFYIPVINYKIKIENINITIGKNEIVISKSLSYYLNGLKKQIDNYALNWDIYKKYTNPYEYIHSIIPYTKHSICKFKPLSRSFYKLIEICNLLNLLNNYDFPIRSFHLAEGPGGFIEALILLRNNKNDKYYAMTLINDSDDNIPGWKKSKYFLSKNENVIIEYGADKKGDLCNVENLWYVFNNFSGTMDFITGDGGFDFSMDFNKQEIMSIKLIFFQICFAIAIQKKGGSFIIKFFDIFVQASIDLIYLLSCLYEKVYILKPCTSRAANSERYIICKNFKLYNTYNFVQKLSTLYPILNSDKEIKRFLTIEIPYLYINKLEDINAIIGQNQLENILSTLNLLENNKQEKIDIIKKNNIQKCIQWCIKNKLPYNRNIHQSNQFLA